jgi:hypothetical protein
MMDRQELAVHFHRLTSVSRADVFGAAESLLRPMNLPADSETMFAGYVGPAYAEECGLLFLAINPGGGGDTYVSRTAEDEIFYPLLLNFKAAESHLIADGFERINVAFATIVKGWNLWRILGPTLQASGRELSEIAYMNVVPYRTRQDKMPSVSARRTAWEKIVLPTIAQIRPRAIVTLGKKAGSVVDSLLTGDIEHYCVPRTIGDTYVSDAASAAHAEMRRRLQSV